MDMDTDMDTDMDMVMDTDTDMNPTWIRTCIAGLGGRGATATRASPLYPPLTHASPCPSMSVAGIADCVTIPG